MREIKFRAWDKEQNKMLLPDKDDWYLCNEYGVLSFPVMITRGYVMSYQTKKELVLMQYTGLKDKNGKEIYEGDLVGENPIGEVIFSKGEFLLAVGDKENYVEYNLNAIRKRNAIIGNIHESEGE